MFSTIVLSATARTPSDYGSEHLDYVDTFELFFAFAIFFHTKIINSSIIVDIPIDMNRLHCMTSYTYNYL